MMALLSQMATVLLVDRTTVILVGTKRDAIFMWYYAPMYAWNNLTGSNGQINLLNPDFGGTIPNGSFPPHKLHNRIVRELRL